jgi:hypothetical protein
MMKAVRMPMDGKHIHAIKVALLASKLSYYLIRNVLSGLRKGRETGQLTTSVPL